MSGIVALRMPKWGLSMEEGKIVKWTIEPGAEIREGDELADIETSKITNVYEAPVSGLVRRILAAPGDTFAVGALIGVVADSSVNEAAIDHFIATDSPPELHEGASDSPGLILRLITLQDGRSLRCAVSGPEAAAPLVLLHGFGGDLNTWALVQPAVSARRRVYAIELPGHGESSKDAGDGSLAALSVACQQAITALGLTAFELAGHSLGGAIALHLAQSSHLQITRLTLIASAGLPGGQINRGYLEGFVGARRARDLKPAVEMLFASPHFVTRDMLEDLIRLRRLDGAQAALEKIAQQMAGGDPAFQALGATLSVLKIPVTLMASEQDQIVGAPDASAMPAQTVLIWLNDTGHMPQFEASGAVAAALLA
jgi:pyruvate dehydrogenase E2 component (dihydrolipoamide acetyltransferase)